MCMWVDAPGSSAAFVSPAPPLVLPTATAVGPADVTTIVPAVRRRCCRFGRCHNLVLTPGCSWRMFAHRWTECCPQCRPCSRTLRHCCSASKRAEPARLDCRPHSGASSEWQRCVPTPQLPKQATAARGLLMATPPTPALHPCRVPPRARAMTMRAMHGWQIWLLPLAWILKAVWVWPVTMPHTETATTTTAATMIAMAMATATVLVARMSTVPVALTASPVTSRFHRSPRTKASYRTRRRTWRALHVLSACSWRRLQGCWHPCALCSVIELGARELGRCRVC